MRCKVNSICNTLIDTNIIITVFILLLLEMRFKINRIAQIYMTDK